MMQRNRPRSVHPGKQAVSRGVFFMVSMLTYDCSLLRKWTIRSGRRRRGNTSPYTAPQK